MGGFDQNRKAREEARIKNDTRREKLAGYFFDLSKLVFAGVVIGGLTPMFSNSASEIGWMTISTGVITTYIFASLANRILK